MPFCSTHVFRSGVGTQRLHRVVGHKALPHEGPERVDGFVRKSAARAFMNRGEKRSAMFTQVVHDFRGPSFKLWPGRKRRTQPGHMVGDVQRDAAVAFAERLEAYTTDLAGAQEGTPL